VGAVGEGCGGIGPVAAAIACGGSERCSTVIHSYSAVGRGGAGERQGIVIGNVIANRAAVGGERSNNRSAGRVDLQVWKCDQGTRQICCVPGSVTDRRAVRQVHRSNRKRRDSTIVWSNRVDECQGIGAGSARISCRPTAIQCQCRCPSDRYYLVQIKCHDDRVARLSIGKPVDVSEYVDEFRSAPTVTIKSLSNRLHREVCHLKMELGLMHDKDTLYLGKPVREWIPRIQD